MGWRERATVGPSAATRTARFRRARSVPEDRRGERRRGRSGGASRRSPGMPLSLRLSGRPAAGSRPTSRPTRPRARPEDPRHRARHPCTGRHRRTLPRLGSSASRGRQETSLSSRSSNGPGNPSRTCSGACSPPGPRRPSRRLQTPRHPRGPPHTQATTPPAAPRGCDGRGGGRGGQEREDARVGLLRKEAVEDLSREHRAGDSVNRLHGDLGDLVPGPLDILDG